ncbi:uncharacterized protein LOC120195184 [Hibiscus syriacus]|uniref:uncharacterized protein LOC120195184 n=1 Tax=Hibiscus syriacus TaxID=106335 RepID=UPI0019236894|nr:uncharacterized protein LOC120195184 [Hibiscus syriacus]
MVMDALSRKTVVELRALLVFLRLTDSGCLLAKLRVEPELQQDVPRASTIVLVVKHEKRSVEFVAKCLVCQQIKTEHQVPSGLLQLIQIPQWKWERVAIDFVTSQDSSMIHWEDHLTLVEFVFNNSFQKKIQMAPYKALYWCKWTTPLCWMELNEGKIVGPDIIRETKEKNHLIQSHLKEACNGQRSYVDLKCKDIEFVEGDKVFLKVSPWNKVYHFGRKGKLKPRFFGPYKNLEIVKPMAYCLALSLELERIHNMFHVSTLQRYQSGSSYVILLEQVELRQDMAYEEELIRILARDVKEMQNKKIP